VVAALADTDMRYAVSRNERYKARRRARAKSRMRRKWRKKSRATKAMILARRALARTDPPEKKVICLRNPFDIAGTGARARDTKGTESTVTDAYYWAIGPRHPYGFVDRYWASGVNPVVGSDNCDAISGIVYRWPPRPDNPTGFVNPSVSPADLQQSVALSDQHLNGKSTYALGHSSSNSNAVTDGRDPALYDTNDTGAEHMFSHFEIKGDIIYSLADKASAATDAARAAVLVKDPNNYTLYTGPTTGWLHYVAVQQFKEKYDDRDLQFSDIYANPRSSCIREGNDGRSAPMDWLRMNKTPGGSAKVTSFRDMGQARMDETTVNSVPAIDKYNSRGLRFKVIEEKIIRFSDTELESRRLRTLPINLKIRPAQRRIWYATDVGGFVAANERGACMNPVFVFLVSSQSVTLGKDSPYEILTELETAYTETPTLSKYPMLFERLRVDAVWSTVS
jgi:hypothetical protein